MKLSQTVDKITFEQASTLPQLFQERCERSPDLEAYRQYEDGRWTGYTWARMRAKVEQWKGALACEGLQRGDRVAVMLRNSVEWVCFDQAALALGLVVVPLYPTDSAGSIAYILGNSGARVLLLGDTERWSSLDRLRPQFPDLARVVCVDTLDGPDDGDLVHELREWLREAPPAPPSRAAEPDALATIVYTSGTTGKPKGVMLSHRNILSNADAVLRIVQGYREDVYLSFLPLSHTLERTAGYYLPMMAGSTVAFARSVQDLAEDLMAVRPTMLVSVPRVYERVYTRVQHELEEKGAPARALFRKAEEVGWHRFEAAQHRGTGGGATEAMMWPVLRRLVADRILARLGGRLRIAVSGGAPISPRLARCFIGLGLPLLQGYGLTEASPIVCANTLEDNVPESVGRPIPDVEVRLGAHDELLVRGPNVMLGYWNDAAKTEQTIDETGWLRTGDIARTDAEGHVYVVGRLKEILVTSTGEKVPPSDIELAITEDPLVDQVMVIGEGRPYVAAIAVLNPQSWPAFARSLGVQDDTRSLLLPQVRDAVRQRMVERLADFPSYARVRQVWLSAEPWTIDNGLITPTMKLRRRHLEARFAQEIERLYEARATAGSVAS